MLDEEEKRWTETMHVEEYQIPLANTVIKVSTVNAVFEICIFVIINEHIPWFSSFHYIVFGGSLLASSGHVGFYLLLWEVTSTLAVYLYSSFLFSSGSFLYSMYMRSVTKLDM